MRVRQRMRGVTHAPCVSHKASYGDMLWSDGACVSHGACVHVYVRMGACEDAFARLVRHEAQHTQAGSSGWWWW